MRFRLEEAETRCSRLTDEAEASRFEIRANGYFNKDLRRSLDANTERKGIIKVEVSTGEEMAGEDLEGGTRRREEVEARIGVAMEALERATKEAERREAKEALRRLEEV